MLNSIIWFLTDTDFSEEWSNASFLRKLILIYKRSSEVDSYLQSSNKQIIYSTVKKQPNYNSIFNIHFIRVLGKFKTS